MSDRNANDELTIRNSGSESRWIRIFANTLIALGVVLAACPVSPLLVGHAWPPGTVVDNLSMIMLGLMSLGTGAWLRIVLRDRAWIVSSESITYVAPNGTELTLRWDEIERVRVHPSEGFRFVSAERLINLRGIDWYQRKEERARVLEILRQHFDIPERRPTFLAVAGELILVFAVLISVGFGMFWLIDFVVTRLHEGQLPWATMLIRQLSRALNHDRKLFSFLAGLSLFACWSGPLVIVCVLGRYRNERSFWHERLSSRDAAEPTPR